MSTNLIPRYQALAQKMAAADNSAAIGNSEWAEKHQEWVDKQFRECPYIDRTTDPELTSSGYLWFEVTFEHYNENGFAEGSTRHSVYVKPSLQWGMELNIAGRNKNGIKEYLHDTLHGWLTEKIDPYAKAQP